jgi:hypothetical protein
MTGAPTILTASFWNFIPLVLVSIALVIFIYRLFRPLTAPSARTASASPKPSPAEEEILTPREKALLDLQQVRGSMDIALFQRDDEYAETVYHEVEAAMLIIKRECGVGPLKGAGLAGDMYGYKAALRAYAAYIDRFYPMLMRGLVEEAKAKAKTFTWTYGPE